LTPKHSEGTLHWLLQCHLFYAPSLPITYVPPMLEITDQEKWWYFGNLVWRAGGNPNYSQEDILYGVVTEFLSLHKTPLQRFSLWPQMLFRWKPQNPSDKQGEVTDFGLVNFTHDTFKLQCGVEVKRPILLMAEMPPAADIKDLNEVKESFFTVRLQAEDQAKATFKNGYPFNSARPIYWILVVGPYWTPIQLGPFSPADLTVRSHKTLSSKDFMARVKIEELKPQPPPNVPELYHFNLGTSYCQLEEILKETNDAAAPYIDHMLGRVREFFILHHKGLL
jgi:hypothetical protein